MDYYSKTNAAALAFQIIKFLRSRGYYGIQCDLVHMGDDLWSVKSNIGPKGFPPRPGPQGGA